MDSLLATLARWNAEALYGAGLIIVTLGDALLHAADAWTGLGHAIAPLDPTGAGR